MTDAFEIFNNIKGAEKSDFKELAVLDKAAAVRRGAIAAAILEAVNAFEFTEEQKEDEDFIYDFKDHVGSLAYSVDCTWNGDEEYYSTWEPGEKIEFWEPSTC